MSNNCEICHKKYASYQSLWIHNKKYHSDDNNRPNNKRTNEKTISCDYCKKLFLNKYTLKNHTNICSIKKHNNEQELNELHNINNEELNEPNNKINEEIELNKIK